MLLDETTRFSEWHEASLYYERCQHRQPVPLLYESCAEGELPKCNHELSASKSPLNTASNSNPSIVAYTHSNCGQNESFPIHLPMCFLFWMTDRKEQGRFQLNKEIICIVLLFCERSVLKRWCLASNIRESTILTRWHAKPFHAESDKSHRSVNRDALQTRHTGTVLLPSQLFVIDKCRRFVITDAVWYYYRIALNIHESVRKAIATWFLH
jgi:hypothetical protein